MPKARRRAAPDRALQDTWVVRLRARDAGALTEVIEAFTERLTAVVSGILRDKDAVEDVVQQAFIKAWYRIEGFKGGSSLYTWLYRVAVNSAKDYIKSRKRRPAVSLEDLVVPANSMPSRGAQALEGLATREARLQVRAAIDELPLRFRAVLALRELEGLSYQEIADVLDLSLGTVESRLFRARGRLRTIMQRTLVQDAPQKDRGASL